MFIDPLDMLALALHAKRSAYAVLLGSGISRAAGIPTGWDVVTDLTRQLARLQGASTLEQADPISWYRSVYREEPDYAALLAAVAKTPDERNQLLRSYFEPTADERARGLKMPTQAHKAIATLAKMGKVRVVVTTNFDRLMEQALDAEGVQPVVLGTDDAVRGAEPLDRVDCTVLKVHGDYLDVRFRNTPEELAAYADGVNALLDRIFDEYGLIICGWSAAWDEALRAALERALGRRYTTYWSTRSALNEQAQRLVALRRAEVIAGKDANMFFTEVLEKVRDLADLDRPPFTKDLAVARAKRYLEAGNAARIRLHDLVAEERERVYERITGPEFPSGGQGAVAAAEVKRRLERYTVICDTLLAVMITGCRWGVSSHVPLWVSSVQRIVPADYDRGFGALGTLRSYPAMLLLYGGCLAALAGERDDTVGSLLADVCVREAGKAKPIYRQLDPDNMLQVEGGRLRQDFQLSEPAGSNYLYRVLRPALRPLVPDDGQYERLFDFFEYLYALLHADARLEAKEPLRAPLGRFVRNRQFRDEQLPALTAEMARAGDQWPYLRAGLFGGSAERLTRVKTHLDQEMYRPGSW